MAQIMNGHIISRLVYIVAKLGVPDLLKNGAASSERLAEIAKVHPRSLYRVMRTLAGSGVFLEKEAGVFELTPIGELLLTDIPNSQRALAILMWEPWWRQGWDELSYSVATGKEAFNHVHGAQLFEYLKKNPEASDLFNRAMTSFTKKEINAILSAYDFSKAGMIIDIGGGYGSLVTSIVKANPNAKGAIFDLPYVMESAKNMVDRDVLERCGMVPGDFFESVPPDGDLYILKSILHDWDDLKAETILKNCRENMPSGSRLLVIERIIPPGNVPSPSKLMDMVMLVNLGGRERTEEEYESLLKSSGFKIVRSIPTASPMHIIESTPA